MKNQGDSTGLLFPFKSRILQKTSFLDIFQMHVSDDPSATTASQRLLRHTVYEQLRAEMISCQLAPGTELREAELASRFAMSKSPVRDALMRLEREGLVLSLPRQGYRVAPISLPDVMDMFHLRAALERACVERIAQDCSDTELKSLNEFRRFKPQDWEGGFLAYNRAFHRRLAHLSGNARLRDHLIELIDLMERAVLMSLSNTKQGDPRALLDEHVALIDALQARAAKLAQRLAERHVNAAGKRVHNAISRSLITH
jgi:DNA-binding GntR family transcriptional regulator